VLTESALDEAPASGVPVLLQADVLRGSERTIRVPVVVGAEVPQAVDVRVRVVTSESGRETSRVVGAATGSGTVGHMRFVHEFSLAPGEYEIQAVVGHRRTEGGFIATLAKARLIVPDIWSNALAVTPIVIGEAVGTARRTDIRPFNFGPTALTPAVKEPFPQSGRMNVAFRIFNWTAKDGEKPDLTVEYLFYQQGDKRLNFFNKIKPQKLTAETLGDAFDPAVGMVTAGMLIPLGSFNIGDFQLRVRVTDNRSKQSDERQVRFAVAP
jgi:hypothetical protein